MGTLSLPLTQGKSALIDADDYAIIADYRWYAVRNRHHWYAAAWVDGKVVYMHRLLMGFPSNDVDHKNGNGLDNRRSSNLRIASKSGNGANSRTWGASGYRGVYRHPSKHCWEAYVYKERRRVWRGCGFVSAEEAARAYDEAARRIHGEFARLNFPEGGA